VDTADRESVGAQRTDHSFRGSYPVGPQGTFVPKRLESPDILVVAAAAAAVATCVAAVPSTNLRRHKVKHTNSSKYFNQHQKMLSGNAALIFDLS
jgi:hypothetical protein